MLKSEGQLEHSSLRRQEGLRLAALGVPVKLCQVFHGPFLWRLIHAAASLH